MISDAELRRTAAKWESDPMIVDLDYVLGVFLSQWYIDKDSPIYRFKGGTCLRKCYFPDHRFSEDLDFTAEKDVQKEDLDGLIHRTVERLDAVFDIDLQAAPPRERLFEDEQGGSTREIRLYYRGPLQRSGSPRSIKLHVSDSESEVLVSPPNDRTIIHPFPDAELLDEVSARCYSLEEILVEKLRALGGQRRFAISRDLFDVHCLLASSQVSLRDVTDLVVPKFSAKGLQSSDANLDTFVSRRDEFEIDWQRNLEHLLPSANTVGFDEAWATGISSIEWLAS